MKIFIIILVSLVIFLIVMQVLDNKGIDTCIFGCHKTEDTHNQVNTYVNGKLVSSR